MPFLKFGNIKFCEIILVGEKIVRPRNGFLLTDFFGKQGRNGKKLGMIYVVGRINPLNSKIKIKILSVTPIHLL